MNKKDFLEKIEFFLKETGFSATKLGKLAKNDPKFVFNLRKGTESREATQRRVLEFMKNYKKQEKK